MRIDRGELPTISTDPDSGRVYDGPIKQNLYGKGQKVPSKRYLENYDKIFKKGVGGEVEDEEDTLG